MDDVRFVLQKPGEPFTCERCSNNIIPFDSEICRKCAEVDGLQLTIERLKMERSQLSGLVAVAKLCREMCMIPHTARDRFDEAVKDLEGKNA